MKHEYVNASDLIQTDMRSGNEKKLDAMLDERGANEMGAETAVVLRNISLELMAQLEQDEKTRPASDADMTVYRGIAANYHKDKAALSQQAAQVAPVVWMGKMDFEALKLRGRVTATLYGEPVGNKTHEVGLCLATPTPPCRRNNHD